jgi:hypothetical protein
LAHWAKQEIVKMYAAEQPDHGHRRLLRARHERPYGCYAAKRDDKFSPSERTGRVGQSSAHMVDAATTMPSNPRTTAGSILAGVNRFFIMCALAPFDSCNFRRRRADLTLTAAPGAWNPNL